MYGTQVYICGFAGGGTGKSDCGMVSPPAWIFAPYYYGLKTHRGRHFPKRRPRWTSQAVHAGDVIETHLVETEPSDGILPRPVPFSVVYEDDDILVVDKPADTPIHPSIGNYEIRWQTALHGILNRKVNPSSTAASTASTATPPALSYSPSTP
mgnify:CR=1 FL=1